MAEAIAAVGLAASVVSIVDFSIKSFKAVKDYLSDVEKAPKWIQDAQANTSYVLSLLERIKTLDEGKLPPNLVASIVEECKAKAERLDGILKGLKLSPKTGSNKAKVFFLSVSLALRSERERGKLGEMSQILGQMKDFLHLELSRLNVEQGQLHLEKQGRVIEAVEEIKVMMIHKLQTSPGALNVTLTKQQDATQTSRGHRERLFTDREIEQASIRRMLKSHCMCPCKCHQMERQSTDPRMGVAWGIALLASAVVIPCSHSSCKYRQGKLDIRIPSNRLFNSKLIQIALKIGSWSISPFLSVQPLIEDRTLSPAWRILHDIISPGTIFPREGWNADITIRQLQKVFNDRQSAPTERFALYCTEGDPSSHYLGSENLLSVAFALLYPAEPEDVSQKEIVKLLRFLIDQGCTLDTSPNLISHACMFKWFFDVPDKGLQDHMGVVTLLHDAGWEIGKLDKDLDIESAHASDLAGRLTFNHFVTLLCLSSHNCDGILGDSELFGAILRNDADTTKRLLEKGADVDERIEFSGDTALHLAVMVQSTERVESSEILDLLLDRSPDVNAKNKRKLRPLDLCAKYSLLDVAIKLLDAGAYLTGDSLFRDGNKDFVRGIISWCLTNDKRASIQDQLDRRLRFRIKQDDLEWCRVYLEAGANTDLRTFDWDFSAFKECAELIKQHGGLLPQVIDGEDRKRFMQGVVKYAGSADRPSHISKVLRDSIRSDDMEKCLLYFENSTQFDLFRNEENNFAELTDLIHEKGGLVQFREGEERVRLQNLLNTSLRNWIKADHVEWCRFLLAAGADGDVSDLYWDYSVSDGIAASILEHGGRIKHLDTVAEKRRAVYAALSVDRWTVFDGRRRYWLNHGDTEWSGVFEEVHAEKFERGEIKFSHCFKEIEKSDKTAFKSIGGALRRVPLQMELDWCVQHGKLAMIKELLLERVCYWASMALRFKDNTSFIPRCIFFMEYCVKYIWSLDLKSQIPTEVLLLLQERGASFRDASETVLDFIEQYGLRGDESPVDGRSEDGYGECGEDKKDNGDTDDENVDEFYDCQTFY